MICGCVSTCLMCCGCRCSVRVQDSHWLAHAPSHNCVCVSLQDLLVELFTDEMPGAVEGSEAPEALATAQPQQLDLQTDDPQLKVRPSNSGRMEPSCLLCSQPQMVPWLPPLQGQGGSHMSMLAPPPPWLLYRRALQVHRLQLPPVVCCPAGTALVKPGRLLCPSLHPAAAAGGLPGRP